MQIDELGDGVWQGYKTQSEKIQLAGIGTLRLLNSPERFFPAFSTFCSHSFGRIILSLTDCSGVQMFVCYSASGDELRDGIEQPLNGISHNFAGAVIARERRTHQSLRVLRA